MHVLNLEKMWLETEAASWKSQLFRLLSIWYRSRGVFHRKLCRLFRASSVENRNILFAVKVMGKSLDCLGNSSLESLRRLMKGADPRKDLRRAESLYNTGNLPAVFQNIFRNRSRGLILEIHVKDQVIVAVAVGVFFSSMTIFFRADRSGSSEDGLKAAT